MPAPRHLLVLLLLPWPAGCEQTEDAGRLRRAVSDKEGYARQVDQECREGRAESCTSVGVQTAAGTFGRKKDPKAAIPFLQQGCQGGDPYGCEQLGVMYQHGRGVTQDHAKARQLYEQACAKQEANACHYLGVYYEQGRDGVAKDAAKAKSYFQKACAAGSESSCNR